MPREGLSKRLRSISIDMTPLRRYPDFRRLWVGQSLSTLGSQLTAVALPFQVYAITHSTLAVGAMSLVEMVPWLAFGVIGGALADALDRRRILVVADAMMAVTSVLFAVNSLNPRPSLWVIYAVVFVGGGFGAAHRTAMRSSIPRLVGVELLPQGNMLETVYYQTNSVVGPALGGLAIATVGLTTTYALDAVTFVMSLVMILRMAPIPRLHDAERVSLRMIAEGFRYVIHSPVVFASQLMDFSAMFFGMPRTVFPALAARIGGGAPTLGLLFAGPAIGSLLLALVSGPFTRIRRQGVGLIGAVAAWSLAILALGFSPWLWLSMVSLAVAGAADSVSGIFRSALVQTVTPDSMRGRLSGVELVFYSTGPALGDFEAGAVASAFGVPFSIISGGVASLIGAGLVALRYPQLVRYRVGEKPPSFVDKLRG